MKKYVTTLQVSLMFWLFSSCQTVTTGGKLVDNSRGEIIISAPHDSLTAMPTSKNDDELKKTKIALEESLKDHPDDIKNLTSYAQILLIEDSFAEADATCRKILRLDLKNDGARKILAQSAIRQRNPELALIFLTKLGGEQSKDSTVLNMIGFIYYQRGLSGDAMRVWKQALSVNSNDISVRMNLGVLYLKYRILNQASAQFERVVKVAPMHQDAKLHLAIIDAANGRHEQAIATYELLLKQDKDNPLVLFNLAASQKAMSLYDDALDSLKTYINVSAERSAKTDQAFAMIEEINTIKSQQGQAVDEQEIRQMASSLDQKPKRQASTNAEPAKANSPAGELGGSEGTPTSPQLGQDQDIDDLEKQLKAH
jgi:tetratricopeptide (TPR) repeat protein